MAKPILRINKPLAFFLRRQTDRLKSSSFFKIYTGVYMHCRFYFAAVAIFLCAGVLFLFALYPDSAGSGTYTSTAHGNSTGGVDRSAVTGSPYPDATGAYPKGHCGHCHEQHASVGGAEPTPPLSEGAMSYALFRSDFGANKNELCFACHETFSLGGMPTGYGRYGFYQGKAKYNVSAHYSSSSMVWAHTPLPPYNDAGNCINCHNPHGYNDGKGVIPRMLISRDSKTGDSPAYGLGGCEGCHDGSISGVPNVNAQLNKTYAHPVHVYNDRHTLPETGQSEGGSSFGPANRHAECVDCHNPHTGAKGNIHVSPVTTGLPGPVSDMQHYVVGVDPASWPSIWTQLTSFTVRRPPTYPNGAQYEYQICFKCHSYYGLGAQASPVSSITGPSGSPITDQAWEFNPNNKSAHPVIVTLNNLTGSYAPKALTAAQMSAPWNVAGNMGNQTMYCSDCHGADNELSGGAKGPHGSVRQYMLAGTGQYWPANASGTLYTLSNIDSNLFCTNCHPIKSGAGGGGGRWGGGGGWGGGSGFINNVHGKYNHQNKPCVTCHVAVPHGSKRSRLIAYYSDVAPYNYNGNTAQLLGFKKAAGPTSYYSSNCQTQSCGSYTHSSPVSGADP